MRQTKRRGRRIRPLYFAQDRLIRGVPFCICAACAQREALMRLHHLGIDDDGRERASWAVSVGGWAEVGERSRPCCFPGQPHRMAALQTLSWESPAHAAPQDFRALLQLMAAAGAGDIILWWAWGQIWSNLERCRAGHAARVGRCGAIWPRGGHASGATFPWPSAARQAPKQPPAPFPSL